jgi:Calpain family cysteine protease/ALTTAQ repeat
MRLTTKRIAALTPKEIKALTTKELGKFTSAQVAALSTAQVGALSPTQLGALSTSAIAGLSPADIATLTTTQLAGLSPTQIGALTTKQIAALTPTDIEALTATQLSKLTATQVAALSTTQLGVLSPSQLGALSTSAITGLSSADITALTITQLGGLSPTQIGALTTTQVAALTAAEIEALTATQLGTLTAAQVAALSTTQLGVLSPSQLGALSTSAIAGLSSVDVAALTATQLGGLSPTQISALKTSAIAGLTETELADLTTPQFESLTSAQIGALTTTDIASLSTTRIAEMSAAQIAGLTASDIGALSSTQLGSISLNYDAMLTILEDDASGGMTSTKFSALQALASELNAPGGISVSSYLQYITDALVDGNAANATWTGGSSGSVSLGNLSASSTQTQVSELIDKWFLGEDLPSSSVDMSGYAPFTVGYSAVTNALFDASGPSISDVNQGDLGDCFLMASLAETALQDPSLIESMITVNSNDTYGVRFYVDGSPVYVTVDNKLADGGDVFNDEDVMSGSSYIWASIVEEAYAELQTGGEVTGNTSANDGNSWSSIGNGGYPEYTLEEITGDTTVTDFNADGSAWSEVTYNDANGPRQSLSGTIEQSGLSTQSLGTALIADLAAGDELVLSSYTNAESDGMITLVADHAMSIIGYEMVGGAMDLEIYNPWGTAPGQTWDTTFYVSLATVLADGDTVSVASSASAPAAIAPVAGSPSTRHAAGGRDSADRGDDGAGTSTVNDDVSVANIALLRQYLAGNFTAGSDGSAGSMVTNPFAPSQALPPVADVTASVTHPHHI